MRRAASGGLASPWRLRAGGKGPAFANLPSPKRSSGFAQAGATADTPTPKRLRVACHPKAKTYGGGAEGNRTPDLRVANNQAERSVPFCIG